MEKQKCNSCGAAVIKTPLWKGQEFDEPFAWNKIIWKNLFKIDWLMLFIIGSLLFTAWAYGNDVSSYKIIYEDRCQFCEDNAPFCADQERESQTPEYAIPDFEIKVNPG